MKRTGSLLLFTLLTMILTLLIGPTSPTAKAQSGEQVLLGGTTPITMLSEGVTSYDMVPPVIIWNDSYSCNLVPTIAAPQEYDEPEIISRIPTYRGLVRELFRQGHDDPDECNPYKIHSNIVFDGEYVYWADDSGLVRLPETANVGDAPEHVASVAKSTRNDNKVELVDGGDHIYAITYAGTDVSSLWQIRKADGVWQLVDHFVGGSDPHNVSFDGDYFYWMRGGFLFKGDPINLSYGFIGVNVTGYYAEGHRISCRNTCVESHYVFIAQGDTVIRYNNLNSSTTTGIYNSVTSDYTIYDLVTGAGFLFILEYKSEGEPITLEHTYHLVRTGRSGGDWGYIYDQVIGTLEPVLINLRTDKNHVYWQETNKLLKLPQNAEALPYINLSISETEVTQGVKSTVNFLPLIRGKRTFIRVVPQADGEAVDWVTAHLQLFDDDDQPMGDVLLPINGMYQKVEPAPAGMVLDTQFLFEVPGSLVDGSNFRYEVTLNPYNEPPELDSERADNVVSGFRSLVPSPKLTLDMFYLSYTFNDTTFSNFPNMPLTIMWINQAYPLAEGADYYEFIPHSLNWGNALGLRVAQIHPDCAMYTSKNKNKCASDYAYNQLHFIHSLMNSDHVFYGLIPDGAGFVRGRGGDGVAVGPAGTSTWGWDFDGAYTDWYTGHEVAHAIGLSHPVPGSDECGHSATDTNYPHADAQIGPGGNQVTGLRRYTGSFDMVYELYSDDDWHDMMSYCPQQWISDYSFERLRTFLNQNQKRPSTVAGAGTELLGIFGVLHPDTQVANIQVLQQFDSGATIPLLVAGDYAIRLLNGQGSVLAEYAFTPHEGEAGESLNFGQIVNWVAGTKTIQIVELTSDDVWAETAVSANPPQVSNVHLFNQPNPVTGEVTLQWTAVDPDNDPLTFDIFYSVDGGTTLQPVVLGVSGNNAQIDTSTLAGGSGIFRVSANDGVHMQTADSPAYDVAEKMPIPTILSPVDGAMFQWGQTIELNGYAFDYEDGTLPAASLRWRVNGKQVGHGASIGVNDLLVGDNEIALIALGSRQDTASTTIHITVHDDLTLSGPDLAVGPTTVHWHVAAGETAVQQQEITIANAGTGDLNWQASESADWLTANISSGTTPAILTLSADPDGLEDGEHKTTNLIIRGYGDNNRVIETAVIPVAISAGNIWANPIITHESRLYLPMVIRH